MGRTVARVMLAVGVVSLAAGCRGEVSTVVDGDEITVGFWVDDAARSALVEELASVEALFTEKTAQVPTVRERGGGLEVVSVVPVAAVGALAGLTGVGEVTVTDRGDGVRQVDVAVVAPVELLAAISGGVGDLPDGDVLEAVTGEMLDIVVAVRGDVTSASFTPVDSPPVAVSFRNDGVEVRASAAEVVPGVLSVELETSQDSGRLRTVAVAAGGLLAGFGVYRWRTRRR